MKKKATNKKIIIPIVGQEFVLDRMCIPEFIAGFLSPVLKKEGFDIGEISIKEASGLSAGIGIKCKINNTDFIFEEENSSIIMYNKKLDFLRAFESINLLPKMYKNSDSYSFKSGDAVSVKTIINSILKMIKSQEEYNEEERVEKIKRDFAQKTLDKIERDIRGLFSAKINIITIITPGNIDIQFCYVNGNLCDIDSFMGMHRISYLNFDTKGELIGGHIDTFIRNEGDLRDLTPEIIKLNLIIKKISKLIGGVYNKNIAKFKKKNPEIDFFKKENLEMDLF